MGRMKELIDKLIERKAQGNSFLEMNIQMKLLLKGIPVHKISDATPENPKLLELIYEVAADFNVELD